MCPIYYILNFAGMSQKIVSYFIILSVLTLMAVGTLSAILWRDEPPIQQHFAEKVNLALRQTAHRLLKQAGDSTSRIAPIKQTAENAFLVKLEHHFNYDSLPVLLQKSFNAYNIHSKYEVAVWDCGYKELILGFSSLDLSQGVDITCGGRIQAGGCFNFSVMFTDLPSTASHSPVWLFGLGGLVASIFLGLGYFFYKSTSRKQMNEQDAPITPTTDAHCIHIGETIFDTRNQTVTIGTTHQKLTFREAKLLELFCNHTNELLERDDILKAVWEDEGVLVGRSVDVFVSRLRKILKNDATLKISNVHSRGYRFETITKNVG